MTTTLDKRIYPPAEVGGTLRLILWNTLLGASSVRASVEFEIEGPETMQKIFAEAESSLPEALDFEGGVEVGETEETGETPVLKEGFLSAPLS